MPRSIGGIVSMQMTADQPTHQSVEVEVRGKQAFVFHLAFHGDVMKARKPQAGV